MRINGKNYKYMVQHCFVDTVDCFNEFTVKSYFKDKNSALNEFKSSKESFKIRSYLTGSVTLYSSDYTVLDKFTKEDKEY